MNVVATNENGEFSFTFTGEAPHTLIFRFVGFVEQELTVTSAGWLEVIMQPNTQELDEVVVVGFGTTSRITNTGAVSAINAAEIRKVPTAHVQTSLDRHIPGIFRQQRGGQKGRDALEYFIWGVSLRKPSSNRPPR